MRRLATLVLVLSTAGLPAAFAQSAVGTGMAAPIGITSPLGIGAGAPVAPTGILLGATELATRRQSIGFKRRASRLDHVSHNMFRRTGIGADSG